MNNQSFITEIRAALLTKGISQTEMARCSGLSQSAVCKFLSGKYPRVAFNTIEALWPIAYGMPFPEKPQPNPHPMEDA